MSKADLIARIEKLEALRAQVVEKVTGEDTDGTVERSESEPTTAIPETNPATQATPVSSHRANGNGDNPMNPGPMPESLRGISQMDLMLLDVDSMLTPSEQAYYNKLKLRFLGRERHRRPGPNDWLGM